MDNAESSSSLDAFTCFPRLPPELRLKVWGFAIMAPRVFKYTIMPAYREINSRKYLWCKKWPARSELECLAPPGVLQTNRESRFEAQKVLEWKFSIEAVASAAEAYYDNPPLPKFFRNDVDIVYIQSPESLCFESLALRLEGIRNLRPVKNLALSLDLWNVLRETLVQWNGLSISDIIRSSFVRIIRCENLIIVIQDRNFNWWKLNDDKDSHYGSDGYFHDEEEMEFQKDGWVRTVKEADEDEEEGEDEHDKDKHEDEQEEEKEEDEESVLRAGFQEVVHNTEYAQFLKAQFEELRDAVIKDEVFKRQAFNKTMVMVKMTVLSE